MSFWGILRLLRMVPSQETMPLREILSSDFDYMRLMDKKQREFLEANTECAECKYLRFCGGGCRAMSFKAYGSIMRKDNETCDFFRNGWLDLVKVLRSRQRILLFREIANSTWKNLNILYFMGIPRGLSVHFGSWRSTLDVIYSEKFFAASFVFCR